MRSRRQCLPVPIAPVAVGQAGVMDDGVQPSSSHHLHCGNRAVLSAVMKLERTVSHRTIGAIASVASPRDPRCVLDPQPYHRAGAEAEQRADLETAGDSQ
jgi:hypothetical protein